MWDSREGRRFEFNDVLLLILEVYLCYDTMYDGQLSPVARLPQLPSRAIAGAMRVELQH